MKFNQKGYMLVEIVIASVLAMTIAFYLLNLTYKFKNQDEDIYQSITYMSDKNLITKNIMNDLEKLVVTKYSVAEDGKTIDLVVQRKDTRAYESRRLQIIHGSATTIEYGKFDTNAYDKTDSSYYRKTLEGSLIVDKLSNPSQSDGNNLMISVPIRSLYSDEKYDIKLFVQTKRILLNQMSAGSYVAFTGTNGCTGKACSGQNANYVSNSNMGYCYNSGSKFKVNGWRVGYVKDGSVYLVSAGALECIKTYVESKSSTTSSRNFSGVLTYLTSSNATWNSSTSTFSLNTPTTAYTFPNDISSLDQKFTCSNATDATCTTLYSVAASSSDKLTLRQYITKTCSSSNNAGSSIYRSCILWSSSASAVYYGTSYTLTKGGFQLSGTLTRSQTPSGSKYTCRSSSSTAICTDLYYIIGNVHIISNRYYASYSMRSFTPKATYYLNSSSYIFGSGYILDANTGTYTLTGASNLTWSSGYATAVNSKKYTCFSNSNSCTTMYELTGDSTSTRAVYYTYTSSSASATSHITNLNHISQKYCDRKYAYGGVCNDQSVWSIGDADFEQITGSALYYNSSTDKSCYAVSSTECGYGNDLIDNGGYYWLAAPYGSSPTYVSFWNPGSRIVTANSLGLVNGYGIRPVLRLAASVYVVEGSGTYEDPYQIDI